MKSTIYYVILFAVVLFNGEMKAMAAAPNQKTVANLQEAFKGETTASAKYAAFSKKAREEGYDRIALMFDATSKAEAIHAANHKAVLVQLGAKVPEVSPEFAVKSTAENLEDALSGESYEIATMYPDFLKDAQAEGVSLALISMNYAYQTEKKHKALYLNAIKALKDGAVNTLSNQYAVCSTCGNTYDTKAPARCGISMTPQERFINFSL